MYIFQAVKTLTQDLSSSGRRWTHIGFWALTVIPLGIALAALLGDFQSWPKMLRTYSIAFIFVLYFSKLFFLPFLLVDDLIRAGKWIAGLFNKDMAPTVAAGNGITRSEFLAWAGTVAVAIPFLSFTYGMVIGAWDYTVKRVRIRKPNLPKAFDGLRIVQISDIHSGSWSFKDPVSRAVKKIMALKPDIIVFTGDLVNDRAKEMIPYKELFSELAAPLGVYSILGNHDYGDYAEWSSQEAKQENMRQMYQMQREMGWDLLLNENRILERDGEQIAVVGVENWSAGGHFRTEGDLAKASAGTEDVPFKVLLSHDPSHWDAEVNKDYPDMDLMLSGHTHGMQFGIDIPGFKWSPARWRYKQWGGLYQKAEQYLYVNRGLGVLGYPGRVGMTPEITLIELERG